ncbi:hypothetical protein IU450_33085 [Nocardia abscessus]|uniref:hypothetical protein n=1 Tax=Nocardia abscessus TaxID=120957 RepID=UPI001894D5BD|nr:hypothetical protein [Nocardia abscessus]MBF6340692.1 hypothetical protein [Nocardia abscessus]
MTVQRDGPAQQEPPTVRPGERVRSGDPTPPAHLRRPPGYWTGHHISGPADFGTQGLLDVVLAEIAAHRYDNPLHRELTRHYVFGGGAPFHLDRRRMTQVIRPGSNHLNILGSSHWREVERIKQALTEPAARARAATAPVRTSAVVVCDDDLPSLGAFTAFVEGTITARFGSALTPEEAAGIELRSQLRSRLPSRSGRPARPAEPVHSDSIYYEFHGTMRWEDEWNFDPQTPDPHGFPATRTADAERVTRLAHDHLPGMPFHVSSETVQVTQIYDAPAATW